MTYDLHRLPSLNIQFGKKWETGISKALSDVDKLKKEGWIFDVFAASVIGGISIRGGRGRIIGVLGGVILLSFISTIIVWFKIDMFLVRALRGVIILGAILLDSMKNKLRDKMLIS